MLPWRAGFAAQLRVTTESIRKVGTRAETAEEDDEFCFFKTKKKEEEDGERKVV